MAYICKKNKSPMGYASPLWGGMCGRHMWQAYLGEKEREKKK